MSELLDYLRRAVEMDASDIFIAPGTPLSIKLSGELQPLGTEKLMPNTTEEMIREIYAMAKRSPEQYLEDGDDDFSFAVPGIARFRVNMYRQRGSISTVIRVVKFTIPDWQKLRIPRDVIELSTQKHGMVLVTGTAGSGKSTTQACIVNEINRTRACHIITLEDPVEFLHRNQKSIVSQREIAIDTESSLTGLRACLRQAPDVIQLGELRDLETIRTAMTAAETGHLLLATLHTRGAVNTVDRIVDTFPADQQAQIRLQLSSVLHTVVSQQLLPAKAGGRVAAFEIMHTNNAIRSMIRDCKTPQIDNAIASGGAEGMISMDQSIFALYKDGTISAETAVAYCNNPEQMQRRLR